MAFVSSNLLCFYWWFEASMVPLLLLIVNWGYEVNRFLASKYMAPYTMAGSLPFLGFIGWEFNSVGSVMMVGGLASVTSNGWWVLGYIPFLVKAPVFSLHSWLPKAHVEAPVAGSMLLAGLTLKLGGYGLLRVKSMLVLEMGVLKVFLMVISLWGSLVASLVCLPQTDYKSLNAYSSISHMGIILAGIMSGSFWGWSGALTLMVGHAFSSSGLFFLAGVVYGGMGSRSFLVCCGVLSVSPYIMLPGFFLLAGNMAAPFTLNLCGEVMLTVGLIAAFKVLWPLLVLIFFVTGAYSLHFFSCLFHGAPGGCVAVWAGPGLGELFVLWAHVVMMVVCIFLLDFLVVFT
uniref:NADH-ubiquinone oxidoreductase chain 4 n=1 Tax=Barbatia virescens TaxID=6559 RepID=A0A346Q3D5_9BIVA|nr:NADH dehydrogenase subunit 4 [Barbatia virescens]